MFDGMILIIGLFILWLVSMGGWIAERLYRKYMLKELKHAYEIKAKECEKEADQKAIRAGLGKEYKPDYTKLGVWHEALDLLREVQK